MDAVVRTALCMVLSWTALGGASSGTRAEPLEIADAMKEVALGYTAVSPDGAFVAYTACVPRVEKEGPAPASLFTKSGFEKRFQGCHVRVVETTTGRALPLPLPDGVSLASAWRPGHRGQLAIYSDRDGIARSWLIDVLTGTQKKLANVQIRASDPIREGVPAWSGDGQYLLVKIPPAGMTVEEADDRIDRAVLGDVGAQSPSDAPQVFRYLEVESKRDSDIGASIRATQYQGDFARIDVESGTVQALSAGANGVFARLSADGRVLAYQDFRGKPLDASAAYAYDLVSVDMRSGRVLRRSRVDKKRYTNGFTSWSPDGRWLTVGECIYQSGDDNVIRLEHPESGDCGTAWDTHRQVTYGLTETQNGDVTVSVLWESDPLQRTVKAVAELPVEHVQILMPRTRDRVWATGNSGEVQLTAVDPKTKETLFLGVTPGQGGFRIIQRKAMWLSANADTAQRDISKDNSTIVFDGDRSDRPTELWYSDDGLQNVKRLTDENSWANQYPFGETRLLEWRGGLDGRRLRGTLVLPSSYEPGKKYPTIVVVYGASSLSRQRYQFGGEARLAQLLATRGFAVLFPDSYVEQGRNMESIVSSIMPGVDEAISSGVVDPDRLGLYGHSYGGYTVLTLLAYTTRFRAAIGVAGAYDPIRDYLYMSPSGDASHQYVYEKSVIGFGGDLWTNLSAYISNNPVYRLQTIRTPLLLLHGAKDTVPVTQADAVYVGLRRLGRPVEYVRYPNIGHSFHRTTAERDSLERTIEWLQKWLTGALHDPALTRTDVRR